MTTRLRRRIVRLLVTLGAVTALWSCNAPFIPVPPPNRVAFTPDATGMLWVAEGGSDDAHAASALFFVYDENTNAGVIQRANLDGTFTTDPFKGTQGDRIHIYFQGMGTEISAEICRLLVPGADPPRCDPGGD